VLAIAFLVYVWHHLRDRTSPAAAIPATRAMAVAFGNSVQLGIPMATALFGEEGLAIHIPLVTTVRNTVLHPVLLPVLAGVVWHVLRIEIPDAVADSVTSLAERNMRFDCTIQDAQVWLAFKGETLHFEPRMLKNAA